MLFILGQSIERKLVILLERIQISLQDHTAFLPLVDDFLGSGQLVDDKGVGPVFASPERITTSSSRILAC